MDYTVQHDFCHTIPIEQLRLQICIKGDGFYELPNGYYKIWTKFKFVAQCFIRYILICIRVFFLFLMYSKLIV